MIIRSVLALVLHNTGLRETKIETEKEKANTRVDYWGYLMADFMGWSTKRPYKDCFSRLYWKGKEEKCPQSLLANGQRWPPRGTILSVLCYYELAPHSLHDHSKEVLSRSQVCRADMRPGTHVWWLQVWPYWLGVKQRQEAWTQMKPRRFNVVS